MAKHPEYTWATGKRKQSIARVRLARGTGAIVVNQRTLEDYFGRSTHPLVVQQPLVVAKCEKQFDIHVNVQGGGTNGQAEAVRHGIARALITLDPELRKVLKPVGLLTRDPRVKERKKYGRKKARRGFQFSKR